MYTDPVPYKSQFDDLWGCNRCALSFSRKRIVLYRGDPRSDIMIISEAPGKSEDEKGIAMVGRSGQKIVTDFALQGYGTDVIYYCHIVCCRPPDDRAPYEPEIAHCSDWLNRQLQLVKPKVIIALGRPVVKRLIPGINPKLNMRDIEGREYTPAFLNGATVIPLRHPGAILKSPSQNEQYKEVIADICKRFPALLNRSAEYERVD